MSDYVDLHCHCVPGIDDGVRSVPEARELLLGLAALGFVEVTATPHMRPGLFDNDAPGIRLAHRRLLDELLRTPTAPGELPLPRIEVSAEHYFDDEIFRRLLQGEAMPYPGGRAALVEFWDMPLHAGVDRSLAKLVRSGVTPVIAHPERYRAVWDDPDALSRLLDVGAVALLDIAALVGKYGKRPRDCAEELLDRGFYAAACSDAHRPADVLEVQASMDQLKRRRGPGELDRLFSSGPRRILEGLTTP